MPRITVGGATSFDGLGRRVRGRRFGFSGRLGKVQGCEQFNTLTEQMRSYQDCEPATSLFLEVFGRIL
jgi:hypothetical protein